MRTFEVEVQKLYYHRVHNGLKTVYGIMLVQADSQKEAEKIVQQLMNEKVNTLQTVDPRIVWEEEAGDRWEYADLTFKRVNAT